MTMFFSSTYLSSRSPCRNASMRSGLEEGELPPRNPIRRIFPGCCASAITARASNTTATGIDGTAAFFITHLVWSVVYHDERGKEKCNLRLKAATFRRGKRPKLYLRLD